MAFTKEIQNAYIADPNKCPFCQSNEINADGIDQEARTCQVECSTCGRSWTEHLTITINGIEEIEEGD
jgi:transcription elongation factor Elf1